jgi:methylenetetrahydrofolate--tRNA-(uracil-5-)-methyltransferase
LRLRADPRVFFAGQITGAEGYVEAAACGAIAGIAAARELAGLPAVDVPADTALGAVVAHLQNAESPDFQPANVTWTFFSPLEQAIRDKRVRRAKLAERALAKIDGFAAAVAPGAALASMT